MSTTLIPQKYNYNHVTPRLERVITELTVTRALPWFRLH